IDELDKLSQQIAEKGPVIMNPFLLSQLPAVLGEALEEYTKLQKDRELKLASYNETSYIIEQLNLKLEKSEELMNAVFASYKEDLQEQLTQVNNSRKTLEGTLSQMPSMGTEYGKNRRLYSIQEQFMLNLQTSKMELEITRAGTVSSNVILSPASMPYEPIKPQKALILGAGATIGIVISLFFLLAKYLIHNKIAGVRELEKLVNVPVLGSIPRYSKQQLELTALIVDKDSRSSLSESLRTIRTNMDFLSSYSNCRKISVTSTISGEGKTFIAANLAAIISMGDQRVCVVDVDMRKPKVHLAFKGDLLEQGMSTILSGKSNWKDCLQETSLKNLTYIPAGPTPPNPSELLLQREFEELISEMEEEFDAIIIDTPPVGLVTDGRLVMKKCDVQLYVVRADYSRRNFTKVINDFKEARQFSNLTCVLNAVNVDAGYGYGYGYGYYSDDTKEKKVANTIKSFF
ncbi:MAG: polysaccharide biosynthesis tyrosine autokinase, partial [Bacteroidota bacterium]